MIEIAQTVITHPSLSGAITTLGIILIEATGDFSWVAPGTRFDEAFCDELTRRGILLGDLVMREPTEAERVQAAVIPL